MSAHELDPRRWAGLAVVLAGAFLISMDFYIVNVSIPAIRATLGASFAQIQLVIAGYSLAFAVGLITGGRLGDIHGRKRMLRMGMIAFAIASVFCGLAPSPAVLIASRVLQGLGAALMFPQVLSLIQVSFMPEEKALAFSLYGMTMGFGNICGNLVGGLLTPADLFGLSWRPIFLINLPVILAALVAAGPLVRETRSEEALRLDLSGTILITIALGALIYPLSVGHEVHWAPWTFLSLGLSCLFLGGFVWLEEKKSRRHDSPLMETSLFRHHAFSLGLVVALLFFCGLGALLVMLTVYLQLGLGLSPLRTGLMFCPFGLAFLAASFLSARLAPKMGARIVQVGTSLMGGGVLWLILQGRLDVSGWGAGAILPGLILYGAGQGLAQPPLIGLILSGVAKKDAGSGSGVVSTVQQVSYAIGVAAIGTVYFTLVGEAPPAGAYVHAFGGTLWINLILLVVTFFLGGRLGSLPPSGTQGQQQENGKNNC